MSETIDIIWKVEGGNIIIISAIFTLYLHPEDSVKKLATAIRRRGGRCSHEGWKFRLLEPISLDKFRSAVKAAKIDWDFLKEYYTWAQSRSGEYRLNHIDQIQQAVLTEGIHL